MKFFLSTAIYAEIFLESQARIFLKLSPDLRIFTLAPLHEHLYLVRAVRLVAG